MGKGCQGQAGSGRSCFLPQAGLSVDLNLLQRVYQRSSLGQGLLCLAQGHVNRAVLWWQVRGCPGAVVSMLC